MVEFALVAPLLLLILFGVVDFGRVIYTYVTLNQAISEGARVAIRDSPLLPTDSDVEAAVNTHAVDVVLANPCPNGPITTAVPPANTGWIYITEPFVGGKTDTVEPLAPSLENAPGGQMWGNSSGGCSAISPAHDHAPLQVTIRYNFVPLTPLLSQVTANRIVITAGAIYRTEY
jgi:hypothetical protein